MMEKVFSKDEIIDKLAHKAVEHKLILFLGAGFSKEIVKSKALSWPELLERIAKHFDISSHENIVDSPIDYPELASMLCRDLYSKSLKTKPSRTYDECVSAVKAYACRVADWCRFRKVEKDDFIDNWCVILKGIDPAIIVTTNYDHVIESLMEGDCVSLTANDVLAGIPKDRIAIYHLHGVCDDPCNIVLTREDYVNAMRPFSYRQSRLTSLLRENSVLYVGYRKNDMNILSALDIAQHTFTDVGCDNDSNREIHVQLVHDPADNGFSNGSVSCSEIVSCIWYDKETQKFMEDLKTRVDKLRKEEDIRYKTEVDKIKEWKEKVPKDDSKWMKDWRYGYAQLFKDARTLFDRRTISNREVIKKFCNAIRDYYDALKESAALPGNFIGYAYCWAFISAYLQVLDDKKAYSLFSVHSPQFGGAIYRLNGMLMKLHNSHQMNDEKWKTSIWAKWFFEDWKKHLSSDVKTAIREKAEVLNVNQEYQYVLDLINKAESIETT